MELSSLKKTRYDLLTSSKDENGVVQEYLLLEEVMPLLLTTKAVDSEDVNNARFEDINKKVKVNGYAISNSEERLQLFIIDERYLSSDYEEYYVSLRNQYEEQFKKVQRFIDDAIKGKLDLLSLPENLRNLVKKLNSENGFEQFDVIDIFLLTLTATVSNKNNTPQPRDIYFKEDLKTYSLKLGNSTSISKEFLINKRVIDLNYLYKVFEYQDSGEPLKIVFKDELQANVEVIKAADERDFESYLCVLNADLIARLYKKYSTQLLEKNVRSFLQFNVVNRGIRDTIKNSPEKFIAYNNGLTITATKAKTATKRNTTYLESLEDFQIVNGGQTTAAIYFSRKDGLDISNVKVMAKINVAKEAKDKELDELISNISQYSNNQSKVSRVDLKARSPKLIALKQYSDTVMSPTGKYWFFERAKGDFNTQVRKSPNPNKLKKDFPIERRFTKELLAKYYCTWGDSPFLVKRGGEKIFRLFIESIDPEDGNGITIDRNFYESLIAKIILFRTLEKVYGQGPNSIGQLRSAAVPYTVSAIYKWKNDGLIIFELEYIWKKEILSENFKANVYKLLKLMNSLIKQYSESDDYGEYSKKEELWKAIKNSKELKEYISNQENIDYLQRL